MSQVRSQTKQIKKLRMPFNQVLKSITSINKKKHSFIPTFLQSQQKKKQKQK